MPQLHLPAEHSPEDIVLAHRIAHVVESQDLYVVWNHAAGAGQVPAVRAYVQEPAHPIVEALAHVIAWVGTFLEAVVAPKRPAQTQPRQPGRQQPLSDPSRPAA